MPRGPHRCPEGRGGAGAPGVMGGREGGRARGGGRAGSRRGLAGGVGAARPGRLLVAISVEWASGEDVTRRNGEGRWGRGDKI